MSEVFADKPEEKLVLTFEWTVDQIEHVWMSIADYNGMRVVHDAGGPLDPMHPLMGIQMEITHRLDDLISVGMREGKYVAPLIRLKQLISNGEELQDA